MSKVMEIEQADHISLKIKAIANKHRIQILNLIIDNDEMCVGDIERSLNGLKQSPISQHLAKLKELGIVKVRQHSQSRFYSIYDHTTRDLINHIQLVFSGDYISSEDSEKFVQSA